MRRRGRAGGTTVAFAGSGVVTMAHGLAARAAGLRVTHVASRTPANAARRAEQLGARAARYDDLPAGADLVVVATPPSSHAAHALAALDGGAAAVVEKPLCATLEDADRLVEASLQHGHRVGYAENLVYAPVVERALAEVEAIAPLRHLVVRATQSRPTWGAFLTREWGGGALFDLGVHPVALALVVAAPARVVAVSAQLEGGDDHPSDEHAEVRLGFDTGLEATVVSSWRGGDALWDLEAASDRGVVRAELVPAPLLERDGDPVALDPGRGLGPVEDLGYVAQLAAFAHDFATGRRPRSDAALGRAVLEVVCAAYASAGDGARPQPLPFTGRRDRPPIELWRPGS